MIIGRELILQLGLSANFKDQILEWGGNTVMMKEPSGILGQTDLTSRDMSKVVINSTEPVSTREATERMVKNIDSTY